MMVKFIEINGCKHYSINGNGSHKIYFYDTMFMVERDFDINHPLGDVYRPKFVSDTLIRFVRQINNTAFIFKKNEWELAGNPFIFNKQYDDFYLLKKTLKKVFNGKKNTK